MTKRNISLLLFHLIVGSINSLVLSLAALLILAVARIYPFGFLIFMIAFINVFALGFSLLGGLVARRVPREYALRFVAFRPATWLALLVGGSLGSELAGLWGAIGFGLVLYLLARRFAAVLVSVIANWLETYFNVRWVSPEPESSNPKKLSAAMVKRFYTYLIVPVLLSTVTIFDNDLHFGLELTTGDLLGIRFLLWVLALVLIGLTWGAEINKTIAEKLIVSRNETALYQMKLFFQMVPGFYGLIAYLLGGSRLDVVLLSAISFVSIVIFQIRQERKLTVGPSVS